MKERIIKGVVTLIVLLILTAVAVIAYFMIAEIETTVIPDESIYTCNIEQKMYMNRKVFILTPENVEKTDMVILYFHGGSYMAEIAQEHWSFLEKIINNTGATVILPDYPLSPKHNYKDVFDMVVPLYNEIVSKINLENFVVMGDSAGGGLALALEEKIVADSSTQEEESKETNQANSENTEKLENTIEKSTVNSNLPAKTILISPWIDVRLENPKIDEVQKVDKDLNKDTLKLAGIAYAGSDGINSYLVNPIDGDLSKLQNITIFTGTYDILNPDVHVLDARAKEQGVTINVKEYKEASHIWILKDDASERELRDQAFYDLINVVNRDCVNRDVPCLTR